MKRCAVKHSITHLKLFNLLISIHLYNEQNYIHLLTENQINHTFLMVEGHV